MIGIIGAMKIEIDDVVAKMDDVQERIFENLIFNVGKLSGCDVVVCECGIGKVNSTMATTAMKILFDIDILINIGVAGGYKSLKQGDTVIGLKTVQHDCDSTPDGLALGQVNGFDSPFFNCDKEIAKIIHQIAIDKGYRCEMGTVASGDQFIASKQKSEWITQTFGAIAYDMESAAINQVCEHFNIKFVPIRSISDNGNDEAMDSFYTFVEKASAVSIDILSSFISSLDPSVKVRKQNL